MLTFSSQGVLSIKCGQAQYLEQSQMESNITNMKETWGRLPQANTAHAEKKYMKWKFYQHQSWKKQNNNSREEGVSNHRIGEFGQLKILYRWPKTWGVNRPRKWNHLFCPLWFKFPRFRQPWLCSAVQSISGPINLQTHRQQPNWNDTMRGHQ